MPNSPFLCHFWDFGIFLPHFPVGVAKMKIFVTAVMVPDKQNGSLSENPLFRIIEH